MSSFAKQCVELSAPIAIMSLSYIAPSLANPPGGGDATPTPFTQHTMGDLEASE